MNLPSLPPLLNSSNPHQHPRCPNSSSSNSSSSYDHRQGCRRLTLIAANAASCPGAPEARCTASQRTTRTSTVPSTIPPITSTTQPHRRTKRQQRSRGNPPDALPPQAPLPWGSSFEGWTAWRPQSTPTGILTSRHSSPALPCCGGRAKRGTLPRATPRPDRKTEFHGGRPAPYRAWQRRPSCVRRRGWPRTERADHKALRCSKAPAAQCRWHPGAFRRAFGTSTVGVGRRGGP
mmetsp:Transcript_26260/g.73315  ORF Transcript_26260/g.73315 Transcript_26260/m.73315 type:complete len:234 (-) Transcript_26260:1961-2662(-)